MLLRLVLLRLIFLLLLRFVVIVQELFHLLLKEIHDGCMWECVLTLLNDRRGGEKV